MAQPYDTLPVCDVTDDNSEWDLTRLRTLVPDNIVVQIKTMLPPSTDAGLDHLAWKWMSTDLFSTAKTYRHLYPSEVADTNMAWAVSYMGSNTNILHSILMVIGRCWSRPDKGWVKFNTDGASSLNISNAFIGKVLRDSDAN
ncbi:hypothetical protein CXB51_027895 [Gossypium anomalum]|uniref:Reverse transcriptase zinc-binding domain-containing protein n=1 Tax=Gossypium anomalum TaxID=47600 RepID=A0A8J5XX79_9ROSI|nr:hypothetical protein CXB51_027895 [Gossypium anomalum]